MKDGIPPAHTRIGEHEGTAIAVPDTETVAAQLDLARMESVFAEPAGVIALGGLMRLMQQGKIQKEERIVLIISGFGFRDPGDIEAVADARVLLDITHLELEIERQKRESASK